MAVAAEEIEKLVREAIAGGATSAEQIVGKVLTKVQAKNASLGVLTISARVITLADLEGRLEGIKELIAPARAVITPAARDLLRQKKIDVGYALPAKTSSKPRLTLVVGVAETKYDARSLTQAIAREGTTVERLAQTGLVQAVREISEEATKGGKLGLLLTCETAAALCLANRRPGMRAVAAAGVAATSRIVRSVGANVLVIDPIGRGAFEMQRIVGQFVAGAPYACPAEYTKELA